MGSGNSQLLREAVQHHQEGRLQSAAAIYRQILQSDPNHPDALHLLGLIAHHAGHHELARESIERAIVLRGNAAPFHNNLGGVYTALGQLDKAIACYRRAIELQPDLADASLNLADLCLSERKLEDAAASYRRVIQLEPHNVYAHRKLAGVLQQQHLCDAAAESYRRALELQPDDAETHFNLAALRAEEGKRTEAVTSYRRAIELKPDYAEAMNNLGIAFKELRLHDEAIACFRRVLELNPANPKAHNNLGNLFSDQGRLAEAAASFCRALELQPSHALAHHNLGNVFKDQGRLDEAIICYRRALEFDPQLAKAHNGLGMALKEQGHVDQAVDCYRRALELQPNLAETHANLADAYKDRGQIKDAIDTYRQALQLDPGCLPAMAGLATSLRGKLPDEEVQSIEVYRDTHPLLSPQRALLQFGLAHVYDGRRDYDRAADVLDDANRLQAEWNERRGQNYDAAEHHTHLSQLIRIFTQEYFRRVAGWGSDSELPVFIVGMPRSGTTLAEQILASHPDVHGAGECHFASQSWQRLAEVAGGQMSPADALQLLTPQLAAELADWQLTRLTDAAGRKCLRIVDKMPDNYQILGWIATLFPNARVIHCRRDVRDVALSCWSTQFERIRWSNNWDHLAERILDYQRIMAHYERVLPIDIFPLDYEALVQNQEPTCRRLLDYVGLTWDPACLNFHQTDRIVRTASVTQVRQPIYSSSIGRWQHYAAAMAPFLDRIQASPRASVK